MLPSRVVYDTLREYGVDFFTGVPDSLLGPFCAHLASRAESRTHVVAANEGAAVALAAGHHLASGRLALVYMQNSGLGNAVNPLMSLAHESVCAIPMILMIGWRGQPGVPDEPQHAAQGAVTLEQLDLLRIPHQLLPPEPDAAVPVIKRVLETSLRESRPHALVVAKNTFEPGPVVRQPVHDSTLSRAQAIAVVAGQAEEDALFVATTGYAGRELFTYRRDREAAADADFLNVGSMGHASQIALAMALRQPRRRVYCLDGDGALIMHLGALAVIGQAAPPNLLHVVLNNGVHDSVGGQPTAAPGIEVCALARGCGYPHAAVARDAAGLASELEHARTLQGPALLDAHCAPGAPQGLGRPTTTPCERKTVLMEWLAE